jgi:hypothetical protein
MSATSSHFKIAKLLIDAGANINDHLISNVSFRCLGTPLSYCTGLNPTSIIPGKPECEERLALLKFLLSQPNINTEQLIYDFHTKKYLTAYQIAIDRKLLETVKIFDEYYINKLKQ